MQVKTVTIGVLLLIPNSTFAQSPAPENISVSVNVTEETGGVFESVFKQALRRLGDVVVQSPDERPAYSLDVVVLCDDPADNCRGSHSFTLAIALFSSIQYDDVRVPLVITNRGLPQTLQASTIALDSLTNVMWMFSSRYRTHHQMWVTSWGRNRYRQAAEELIAEIDTRCFERTRLGNRLLQAFEAGDDERTDVISRELEDGDWICRKW